MITLELAARLRDAGLTWEPASGDRFVVPDRDLDTEVFVISEMTVEPEQLVSGGVVRFNGTTEWAMDSIEQSEVIWLPHEAQLRARLGEHFLRLEKVHDGFVVELRATGAGSDAVPDLPVTRHLDIDAERAYARALLAVLTA
ncbi:MAG: pilus assembly protein CpaE [Actinomycetota bacterium]|nr:pilus assembly protein CpaE [Actinomycetota bacterium]